MLYRVHYCMCRELNRITLAAVVQKMRKRITPQINVGGAVSAVAFYDRSCIEKQGHHAIKKANW